jgi:hypothetical protein
MKQLVFKLMLERVDGRLGAYSEGKEFHILGADELKAREPLTMRTRG